MRREPTEAQARASHENWSLRILYGFQRTVGYVRGTMPYSTYHALCAAINNAIIDIKLRQLERKHK